MVDKSLNEDNFSWRVGLDWKVMPETLLYVTIAKGFKSGAFSTIPDEFENQFTPATIKTNPVDPVCPMTAPGLPCSFVGEAFPNTPKYEFTADVGERFPMGDGKQACVGGNLVYHSATDGALGSDQSTLAAAAFRIPAYTVLDLRAGLTSRGGKWAVEAWGRNVTNAFCSTGVSRSFEEVTRYLGTPVTYGVRLRWRF